ncbi:putative serine peptidase, family S28 [Aspergillus melleus]|uniref:putative serine peptidase, family S28 n=1 Tax=Aspergillus melleus TaxID=138277 RepID=UPI001E8E83A7|nr:uncharacterized protein LDX57_007664 [Aspergillus melleus]KAH8429991.1 hypothetical protein LDX57_007664 [Aspergillus melleus]
MFIFTYSSLFSLVLLSSPVLGLGLHNLEFTRQLDLAAELGIDPGQYLDDRSTFHSLISHGPNQAPAVPAEYVEIPIDHYNLSVGTYNNRYWVNEEFFVPGSPVILYDAGESGAEATAQSRLMSDLSFFRRMLQDLQAIGIVWEHRYFGDSLPFPVNNNTPAEHLQYHTTKQALQDIPHFAKTFSRKSHPDLDLTPKSTPWVMVGGSYAGSRAAFTRNEHPDTIFAAFSSSAPVQARVDMGIYYEPVYRGMVANGLGNCTKDIHAALKYIDEQLSEPQTSASIKKLFLGDGAENNSNEDFTTALGSLYGFFQNYGTAGTSVGSLEDFCNYLELDPETNQTAGPEGLAPTLGNKHLAERWASWPVFTPLVNLNTGANCRKADDSLPLDCELNSPLTDPDSISWTWMYCTEWGFLQSNNFGPHGLLSRYQTLEYQQWICDRQFPGMIPAHPQADALNAELGGWDIRPSNVYFSGGEFDPWRTLSIVSTEEIAPQDVAWTTEIPECGVTKPNTIFGQILKNSMHCYDFQPTSTPGKASRELFQAALKEWLKCYKPTEGSAS